MATIFTKIINREFPGRFVYEDEVCVAFLSIHPLKPGHTLLVPREEVDHWVDLSESTLLHMTRVSQRIARALQAAFSPVKVGSMYAGLEVPHVHQHLVPINGVRDLDFANADLNPDPADLDAAAEKIRAALTE